MKWLQVCLQPIGPRVHEAAANCVLGAPRDIDPAMSGQADAGCDLVMSGSSLNLNEKEASALKPL
jgi:hypothetical protein